MIELRRRKQRNAKPFALMVGDLAMAHAIVEISKSEEALLESRRRPIVSVAQAVGRGRGPSCRLPQTVSLA